MFTKKGIFIGYLTFFVNNISFLSGAAWYKDQEHEAIRKLWKPMKFVGLTEFTGESE